MGDVLGNDIDDTYDRVTEEIDHEANIGPAAGPGGHVTFMLYDMTGGMTLTC